MGANVCTVTGAAVVGLTAGLTATVALGVLPGWFGGGTVPQLDAGGCPGPGLGAVAVQPASATSSASHKLPDFSTRTFCGSAAALQAVSAAIAS